ncbi:MAG: bifunctional oligoribonuclease/PAP phosphatase NrnA [Elusimicrobiota bacterium]|jgi:phosphoesterase RecJ-like protein|nr:bifunctional oligoribonuclease/PAP phosphatase NrnA [Elusimicrobiota bacterium]
MNSSNSHKKTLSKIAQIIRSSKTFFIAGHIKPDGDSLGSSLGLAEALEIMGKKACVYCIDDVPENLKFLKNSNLIKKNTKEYEKFDCAIILESMNFERIGNIISPKQAGKIINIDHHLSYGEFGDANYVVPDSSSTAELILNIVEYMKVKISKSCAQSIYTGILTDTGRFQQSNTTPNSHIAAAKLISYGADVNEIYKKVYESSSVEALKLQGLALEKIKTLYKNQFVYTILTKKMLKKSGVKSEASEGIVNYTLRIEGAKIGCLFKEVDKKSTKISFRSVKSFNALEIAQKYGGGGHKNAAGCCVNRNIDDTIKEISKTIREKLNAKSL